MNDGTQKVCVQETGLLLCLGLQNKSFYFAFNQNESSFMLVVFCDPVLQG